MVQAQRELLRTCLATPPQFEILGFFHLWATAIFWSCHHEVLCHFLAGGLDKFCFPRCWCLWKRSPVVLGSYWSIPKDWTANHQIVFLWRKFPVEKFEIQKKVIETYKCLYIHNTGPFKMFNALNPFLQVVFLLSPFGYIHLCLRIISRKCFALDFQCLGWVVLDVSCEHSPSFGHVPRLMLEDFWGNFQCIF